MGDAIMLGSRSVVSRNGVSTDGLLARKAAVAGWLLAAALLGFPAGGRCLGGPPAKTASAEADSLDAIYAKIGEEIKTPDEGEGSRYFYLSAVVKDRKAQCLGYSQLFYILGKSVGLPISAADVLESAAGPLPAGEGHVACLPNPLAGDKSLLR
jgi:hypothetical protein